MTRRDYLILFLLGMLPLVGAVGTALGDEREHHRRGHDDEHEHRRRRSRGRRRRRRKGHDDDYKKAREAIRRGEVVPLAEVLKVAQARHPGEIVEVEFDRHKGAWVYEIKLVDKKGRLIEIYVDAKTKEILDVVGK